MQWLKKTLLFLLAIGCLLGLWAFWLEPASFTIQQHDLKLQNWPSSCDGVKIAVLSDLHVGAPYITIDKIRSIVQKTNEQKPDLILLAGDYVIQGVVGGHFTTPEDIAEALQNLHAPLGVAAVLGNHDWWLDGNRMSNALNNVGITVLENQSQFLTQPSGCELTLMGIGDFTTQHDDLQKAFSNVPVGNTIIAFTHNPDIFTKIPANVNLTIAGHTHGGQVNLPWLGRLIVPSDYGERYAAGHVVEDQRDLFVNTGIGTSILPVRFLVTPEISILTLHGL